MNVRTSVPEHDHPLGGRSSYCYDRAYNHSSRTGSIPKTGKCVGDSSGRARVQFKLPDGEAHTAHFDVTTTLADVQRYVAENLQ
ncbi:jg26229, partial [Pararge aegeria aegeria]